MPPYFLFFMTGNPMIMIMTRWHVSHCGQFLHAVLSLSLLGVSLNPIPWVVGSCPTAGILLRLIPYTGDLREVLSMDSSLCLVSDSA